jgi:argonaute-like protein implicated in RNA metabolism and viral defense
VERVGNSVLPGVIDGELNTVARAAIREVVSALRNHAKSPHIRVMTFEAAADWLELEADRG